MDIRENKNDINEAYALISGSPVRNNMILEDTRACVMEGRTPVILTKYKEQARCLYDHLQTDADHVFLLYGDNSDKENSAVRQQAGCKVTVITVNPQCISYGSPEFCYELVREMQHSGIYVMEREEVAEHFAVIDDALVWHGGMNLLGKEDAWDNLIRIKSASVAAELLEITLKREVGEV